MEKPSPLSLSDAINYKPETYLKEDDITWIQNTFRDNPKAINILRKIFLPTIEDGSLPIEEFTKDSFGAGYQFQQIPDEHIKALVVARQDAIKFIIGGLIQLKVIANVQDPSRQQVREAARKNKND